MARLNINLGTTANDRTGDPLRTAFEKVNNNFIELYTRTGDDIQIPALAGNDGKLLTVSAGVLSWGTTNRLVAADNDLVLDTEGGLTYRGEALQKASGVVTCAGNNSTIVYTASGQFQHAIRLLVLVEGFEGASSTWDTQACEMIIAKSFRGDDIAASVYGIVYTSAEPLATFTAEWDPTLLRVQVLCTTPGANSVDVKTFVTEITTSD
jgi:hypothetical protein